MAAVSHRERVAAASRCTLNRFEITIKVLLRYIFAMLLLAVKYMACKLLTDAASRRPLNRLAITIAESQNKHLCNSIA